MFSPDVVKAAKAHAIAQYPKEACGVVVSDAYIALENQSADPENLFALPPDTFATHAVAAVIHSHCHPKHGPAPSAADMTSQMSAAVPFGIVYTDGKVAGDPLWFGDHLLDVPLFNERGDHVSRPFMHGVNDCYSMIRTWYWQERKIKLLEFPRDNDWWQHGGDLYREGYAKAGFKEFAVGPMLPASIEAGTVVLMKWGSSPVPFHAGIVVEKGLILHHLNQRLSRREPLARWVRQATHWLRYEG